MKPLAIFLLIAAAFALSPLAAQQPATNTTGIAAAGNSARPPGSLRRSGKAPMLRAAVTVPASGRAAIPPGKRRYIVTLANAANQDECVKNHAITREQSIRHVVNSFVACLDDVTVERLRDRLDVLGIEEDQPTRSLSQIVPTGLKRMAVEQFPPAMINGLDERVDVDVCVMEEKGVQTNHPDLNVYQTTSIFAGYVVDDHATASAGVIGAFDNTFGTVGIVPGARIWSVCMSGAGQAYLSDIIAGFDYIYQHADEIEVVNCSFGLVPYGQQWLRGTSEDLAVQRCVERGVVVVCGAGNNAKDIAGPNGILDDGQICDNMYPAGIPESMAVSAMDPVVDEFASYSNFSTSNHNGRFVFSPGAAIDVAGPSHVATTTSGSAYTTSYNGTSCATPHVAGLVALYIATHGRATNAAGVYRIRQAIVDAAQPQSQWQTMNPRDPDTNHEGLAQASLAWMTNAPRFTQMVKTPSSFDLDFTTVSGYRHTLQSSEVVGPPWADLTTVDGTGSATNYADTAPGTSRFYRLLSRASAWPQPDLTPAVNLGSAGPAANGTFRLETRGVPGALIGEVGNTALRQTADNAGSRVTVPNLPALNPAGPFSVEVWAKPGLGGSAPYLNFPFLAGSRDQSFFGGWFLVQFLPSASSNNGINLNGFAFGCYLTPAARFAETSVTIDTNLWYHVAGVFDGANMILYVNGSISATTPIPGGYSYLPNTNQMTAFGNESTSSRWFQGDLDEAAIYPYALTAGQVQAHYQAGTNAAPPTPYQQVILGDNPAGYWRFNE